MERTKYYDVEDETLSIEVFFNNKNNIAFKIEFDGSDEWDAINIIELDEETAVKFRGQMNKALKEYRNNNNG